MQAKQIVPTFQDFAYGRVRLTESAALISLISFAILSFICTLWLPSVGEEGVYTNTSLEMVFNNNYLVPKLFGTHYSRPPLFNWFIIAIMKVVGPVHVLLAARIVNIAATSSTLGLLIWFVRQIFPERNFALLTGALYLSGDLLLKRGWIAYADSLFAFCIFASIVCLWMYLQREQSRWVLCAALSLCCAFLTKIHTAYIFYAIAGFVLYLSHARSRLLFSPMSIFTHALAIIFPFVWTGYVNHGYGGLGTTWSQSQGLLAWPGWLAFMQRTLIFFPVDLLIRFMPGSLLALITWYRLRSAHKRSAQHAVINSIFWITILNLLPYWFAPKSNTRYLLPLYPFAAILMSYIIWQGGNKIRSITVSSLIGIVVLKYALCVWWFPYEHNVFRGNALQVAQEILAITQDNKLFINDSSAPGLRVSVEINKINYAKAPLVMAGQNDYGYVLYDYYEPHLGELINTYRLRNDKLYLVLRASTT